MTASSHPTARMSPLERVSWPLELLNAAVVVTASVAFARMVRDMPDVVPVHWGMSGADGFGRPGFLWMFLGILVFDTVTSWIVIASTARQEAPDGLLLPHRYRGLMKERKHLVTHMSQWLFTNVNVGFVIIWLGGAHAARTLDDSLVAKAIGAGFAVMAVGLAVPMWVYGRRIGALHRRMVALGGPGTPGTIESGWRGVIYYAPDDERLIVDKRYGVGWTFNFARPGAWLVLLVLLTLPVAIAAVLALLR